MRKEKFSEQQKSEAIQRYNNGESASAIGRSFKVSESLITRILKSHNIKIRNNTLPAILDENIIKLYNEEKSIKSIAKLYKSSYGRIEKFLLDSNIVLRNYRCPRSDIWKPNKELADKIIQEYNDGKSARQISLEHSIADVTITDFLKRNKIFIRDRSNAKRTNQIKENIFDEINEESAYWIGFILSDGNIYYPKNRSKQLNFGLKQSDWEHLEKFKKFIGSNKQLYYNNKAVFISFYSNKIVEKLEEFGIMERKSSTAKVPEILKDNRHFWRGMVDGDGWISVDNISSDNIGLCGTVDIIKSFIQFVGIENKISHRDLNKNFAEIKVAGKEAVRICRLLYDNSKIYLDRKYENYKKICLWKPQYIQNRSLVIQ